MDLTTLPTATLTDKMANFVMSIYGSAAAVARPNRLEWPGCWCRSIWLASEQNSGCDHKQEHATSNESCFWR